MSDLKAKTNEKRFRLGLRPRPHWKSLRSPDFLAKFKGPALLLRKGRGEEEREREERGRGGREKREGKG